MNVNFYKIVCNNTGAVYVGSTCKTIEERLQQHISNYRKYLNGHYNFVNSYIVLEKKNYTVQLIDTVLCTDKKHRDTLERLHILNEECVNRNQPGRDAKQYYQDNKEKIKEYQQDNKEKIKEQKKQYRSDNKDNIQQYKKRYYTENKEKLKQKFNCLCGGKYILANKLRHLKTKLHIDYLATL